MSFSTFSATAQVLEVVRGLGRVVERPPVAERVRALRGAGLALARRPSRPSRAGRRSRCRSCRGRLRAARRCTASGRPRTGRARRSGERSFPSASRWRGPWRRRATASRRSGRSGQRHGHRRALRVLGHCAAAGDAAAAKATSVDAIREDAANRARSQVLVIESSETVDGEASMRSRSITSGVGQTVAPPTGLPGARRPVRGRARARAQVRFQGRDDDRCDRRQMRPDEFEVTLAIKLDVEAGR